MFKSRLRSAQPSESQRTRSRSRWRNAPKPPTQNTIAKKRARQESMGSDYRFANFLQHSAFRSTDNKANLSRRLRGVVFRQSYAAVRSDSSNTTDIPKNVRSLLA